eukprot:TRINITY_DN1227_c0_g3_i1.p1 TRINITY_DN1227_c0_g3~~TRINITY_DN1227_c0_g3_i1.p1  ORF type:complete len:374 (+),score=96.60 TRINITY_DN1227_c0_g3_i1:645-1766(+)
MGARTSKEKNRCARIGVNAEVVITSELITKIWYKYTDKDVLDPDKSRKFLVDFAEATGIEYNEDIINMTVFVAYRTTDAVDGTKGLDLRSFMRLVCTFVETTPGTTVLSNSVLDNMDKEFSNSLELFDEDMSRILDGDEKSSPLYLTSLPTAANLRLLRARNVGAVLSLTMKFCQFYAETVSYKQVRVYDSNKTEIREYMTECLQYLNDHLTVCIKTNEDGGEQEHGHKAVLVHCDAGVSRSASMVILYLMFHRDMSLLQAYLLVKERRTRICPNIGFCQQLMEFERERVEARREDAGKERSSELDEDTSRQFYTTYLVSSRLGNGSGVTFDFLLPYVQAMAESDLQSPYHTLAQAHDDWMKQEQSDHPTTDP